MNHRLLLLLLAAHAGSALAQYKCTAANGAITFQQTPCSGAQAQETLVVVPNGHPAPASGAAPTGVQAAASGQAAKVEPNVDKRMLAGYERQRRREALVQALQAAQDDRARRAVDRVAATTAARQQFGDDPAHAAALRDALASIARRHDALTELDDSRIRKAQAALDTWDKTQSTSGK